MTLAVRAEALGKDYLVGVPRRGVVTLGETLHGLVRKPLSRRHAADSTARRRVTVLDDVSFDVRQGEAVGFIGHNGAGKSTLLKVLTRITAPTRGRAEIMGRCGALLEVATGFHPELTGRENVFLNGAVLGMTRNETRRRFEQIVEFADVARFLDTPVKRWSSGMVVRLAFAVAAHLEPDVLIVDEVLAVGDVGFQRRCLRRMAEVADAGSTVLFVSHNMSIVQSLCQRAVVLDGGRVVHDGPVADAVGAYLRRLEDLQGVDLRLRTDRSGLGDMRVVEVVVDGRAGAAPSSGEQVRIELQVEGATASTTCDVRLVNEQGIVLSTLSSAFPAPQDVTGERPGRFVCEIEELLLAPGRYRVDVVLRSGPVVQDDIQAAAMLDVTPGPVRGRAASLRSPGDVLLPHRWTSPP